MVRLPFYKNRSGYHWGVRLETEIRDSDSSQGVTAAVQETRKWDSQLKQQKSFEGPRANPLKSKKASGSLWFFFS